MNTLWKLYLLPALLLLGACKLPEIPDESNKFIRLYGTQGEEIAWDLVQTSDDGFAILGQKTVSGNDKDALLIRTDRNGKFIWQKQYGDSEDDVLRDILVLGDGSFLMAGHKRNATSGKTDGWIVHVLDGDGKVDWQRTYGTQPVNKTLYALEVFDQGKIAAVGEINGGFWMLITNSSGEIIRERDWGIGTNSRASSISVDKAGSKLIACGQSGSKIQLLEVANSEAWDITSSPDWSDMGTTGTGIGIGQWGGSCLVIAGEGKGNDPPYARRVQIKIRNNSGCIRSDTTILLGDKDDFVISRNFPSLGDSAIILAGSSASYNRDMKDIFIVRVNLITGKVIGKELFGGRFDDVAVSIIETTTGYAITGHTNSFGYDGQPDIFLMKLGKDGKLADD